MIARVNGVHMTSPLVSVAHLSSAVAGADAPLLLDVRWSLTGPPGIDTYRAGHLPGAVFVDLDRDLAGPPGPAGRHPLPAPEEATEALRRLGVRADRAVVAYDDGDASVAARAWWLLRWAGHDDVRVLDGGYAAWLAAGLPVVAGDPPAVTPGDVVVRPGGMPLVDADEAAAVARAGVLLDVRAPARFRGETEPVDPVAGHVPGARNAPLAGNLGPDGRFLDPERLAARFAALGVSPGVDVAAYCGSGVSAAQTVLALEVAGLSGALFVGSWSHWVADPARPVATGP
jgi:thiosulfate/3-mercaptopyruvate sulfurtransferase